MGKIIEDMDKEIELEDNKKILRWYKGFSNVEIIKQIKNVNLSDVLKKKTTGAKKTSFNSQNL